VLVRSEEQGALVIGQLSHAWLSGQLARAWGNECFAEPDPREEIALGAEQHDVGWALFDLAPGRSATSGLPCSFLETTVEQHLEIWRTAPDRLLSVSTYAALVVSLHGASLSALRLGGAREGRELLERHVADERARQARLRKQLGLTERDTQRIQRWMWAWDGLSLALCNGWDPFTSRDVPAGDELVDLELRRLGDAPASLGAGTREEGAFSLDPLPFSAGRLVVWCEARELGSARFEHEQPMQRALDEAQVVRLRFVLRPRGA
jgi:Protein of unknown function (DUF3891)